MDSRMTSGTREGRTAGGLAERDPDGERELEGVGCCAAGSFLLEGFGTESGSCSTAVSLDEFDGCLGTRSGTRAACEAFPGTLPGVCTPSGAVDRDRDFD